MRLDHFSDTIYGWTTQKRIWLWYEVLTKVLWVEVESPSYVSSKFWNSFETAAQAVAHLQMLHEAHSELETQVILINNASRAKHKNNKDAKGSDCLIAEVEVNWQSHFFIWVDDEAFSFVRFFLKPGTQIHTVKGIDFIDDERWLNFQIEDLSKWTQFRSKEHFPLAQLLTIRHLQRYTHLDLSKWVEWLILQDFDTSLLLWDKQVRAKVLELLWEEDKFEEKWEIQSSEVFTTLNTYSRKLRDLVSRWWSNPRNKRAYIDWFVRIEKVQLLWELHLLKQKLWIDLLENSFWNSLCSWEKVVQYNTIRESLALNELLLIDRDGFWNGIFATNKSINWWIADICEALGYKIWDKIKISWWTRSFVVIITKSINDYSWENCMWNSSSRWPSSEILINMNKSADETYTKLEEIQNLPIWTKLSISKVK